MKVFRSKKWKNLREKSGSSSKENVGSNAQNVGRDAVLFNVPHNNDSDWCDIKKNLKVSPNSFLGTNMVSEANNVDNNNTENEGRYKTKHQSRK